MRARERERERRTGSHPQTRRGERGEGEKGKRVKLGDRGRRGRATGVHGSPRAPLRLNVIHGGTAYTGSERIDFHAPYLCAPESHRRAGEDGADRRRRAVGAVERGARESPATWTSARGDVSRSGAWPRRHDGGGGGGPSPSVSADSHGLGFLARTQATRSYRQTHLTLAPRSHCTC